jgi:hypothetical protein
MRVLYKCNDSEISTTATELTVNNDCDIETGQMDVVRPQNRMSWLRDSAHCFRIKSIA